MEQTDTLYNRLCTEVRRFTPGARFHTVREIIDNFDTNRRIVDAALERMEKKGIVERRSRSGIFVRQSGFLRKIVHFYPDWPSEACQLRTARFRTVFEEAGTYEYAGLPFNYQHELLPILKECDADMILVDWPARPIRPDEIAEIARCRTPLVVMGRDLRDASIHCSYSDSGYGALIAVNHLQKNGHRKLAMLQAEPAVGGNAAFQENVLLYGRVCGCEVTNIDCRATDGDYSPEQAYANLNCYLDGNGCDFTALIVNSGFAAKGALLALAEHGIRVPEDVSLIGVGSPEATKLLNPPLTIVEGAHESTRLKAEVDRYFRNPDSGLIAVAIRANLIQRKSVRNIKPPKEQESL